MPPVRALLAILGLALAAVPLPAMSETVLTIAGGRVAGSNFATAGAVQAVVNRAPAAGNAPRLVVVPTDGAEENLAGLAAGRFDLAIVAADWLARAGKDAAGEPPFGALLVLGADVLTVLARADAGISSLGDLAGRRIAAGPEGSGGAVLARLLAEAMGWPAAPLTAEGPQALCAGAADAAILVVAHPNGPVLEATGACPMAAVAVDGEAAALLSALYPGLVPAVVPGGVYPGITSDVPSVGLGRVLVGSSHLAEGEAEAIVQAVLGGAGDLAAQHPILSRIDPAAMAAPMDGVAMHPGATAALREAGLAP
jgi:TRAP transporter TAXI family solute receptor